MKTSKLLSSLAAGLVLVALTGSARADGISLGARHLKVKDRTTLKAEIGKVRAANPAIFAKVAEAPKLAQEADEQKRGRAASITLSLTALGKDALFPMLEMLAVDGPTRGKSSESTWTTLRVGLIEAVGLTRDVRATPVLNAILDRESDFEVVRAAAEALGRIGDDASTKRLARLAVAPGAKQAAVVSALGECRRIKAASTLAQLTQTTDETQLLVVVKSLGTVGNAWAWQTPEIQKSGEGDRVRAIAARALLGVFVKNDGFVRSKAERALLVVNDPGTPALIAGAKQGASAELARALDALASKLAANPAN